MNEGRHRKSDISVEGGAVESGAVGETPSAPNLQIFIKEITRQVQAAAMCASLLNSASQALVRLLPTQPVEPFTSDSPDIEQALEAVFFASQGMLTAGALVSKMLWNSEPQGTAGATHRCNELRAALDIDDEMPELILRVRNGFEHFDTRLDNYLLDDNAEYFDMVVGSADTIIGRSGLAVNYLRRFDPVTCELAVLDEAISLPALLTVLHDIRERARLWLRENLGAT